MITPGLRAERDRGDAREMANIRGPLIEWTVDGAPPRTWLVTYRLRTHLSARETRDRHRVRFNLGDGYPTTRPFVVMLDRPVFHPNIFEDGRICIGDWRFDEGLAFLVIRIARMLLYFAPPTDPASPANLRAAQWFLDNRGAFPLQRDIVFPDPLIDVRPSVGAVRVRELRRP